MSKLNAAIARGLFGWKTLAELLPDAPASIETVWIDPENGVVRLPSYCDNMDLCWPILTVIRERGHAEKFLSILPEVIYEDSGEKFDPAYTIFWLTPARICQAVVKLYGLELR